MRHLIPFLLFAFSVLTATSQPLKKAEKKYPSLLWEITGNGLTKPSYLFGTMHVSNKQVFHLSDSFFIAIKRADVVALELNSETWQRDMVQMDKDGETYRKFYTDNNMSGNYVTARSFRINKNFTDDVKYALQRQPYVINSLLYRNNEGEDDYEEDTFLDMYIYQTGKKLGKRSSGVESYYEMQMMSMGAEIDRNNEKNKKRKNYDLDYSDNPQQKADEAYRKGDLDLLDSLEKMMMVSEAFTEKFLYQRNEKQANSMDTIIKKGNSLFVGVGAAHLPGERGVIELLRKKGYKLRPIKMIDRDAVQREKIDHLHVPVTFIDNVSEDGLYKVRLPGVLYKRSDLTGGTGWQYADMANGAYYTITRIENTGGFTGISEAEAFRKVDSMLYDNIPGKILSRSVTVKNGYKCIDLTNKTRRGDVQRYNIVFTAFEILIFKMSATENYVLGKEAEEFFKSITIAPYRVNNNWVNFQPASGGFAVQLPHKPYLRNENEGDWVYAANDNTVNYLIVKRTIFDDTKLLRDTLNLGLAEESFTGKEKGLKTLERKFTEKDKVTALDALYQTADTSFLKAHYVINGPHYYMMAAKSKNKNELSNNRALSSFSLIPFTYTSPEYFSDTLLHFETQTPVVPKMNDSLKALLHQYSSGNRYGSYGNNSEEVYDKYGTRKSMVFSNDTTGEMIVVSSGKYGKYYFEDDSLKKYRGIADSLSKAISDDQLLTKKLDSLSARIRGEKNYYNDIDSMYIVKEKKFIYRNGINQYLIRFTDTGCSRIVSRYFITKDDRSYTVTTITGAAQEQSSFVKQFFSSFKPFGISGGRDVLVNKVDTFFTDYYGKDTSLRKMARSAITSIDFKRSDFDKMLTAMNKLSLKDKDYFETKASWISAIGDIKDSSANPLVMSTLKSIYEKSADTALFQQAVLRALVQRRTAESYGLFKQYILQDPPVSDNDYSYDNEYWQNEDSLGLLKTLFPDILQLTNLEDYKDKVTNLLVKLVDSNKLAAADYETYFSKILFDARIALKKQLLKEEKKVQDELSKEDDDKASYNNYNSDNGNDDLTDYTVLLLPFYDKNPAVPKYFDKLWNVKDEQVKFDLLLKMLAKNKPVPDTMISHFAAVEEKRGALYYRLAKLKKAELFPEAYKVQEDMAKAFLYTSIDAEDKEEENNSLLAGNKKFMQKYFEAMSFLKYRYNDESVNKKMDSILLIKKQLIETEKGKGYVYFFKYREKKEDKWRIAVSGIQPTDSGAISYKNIYTKFTGEKIKDDEPLEEQLSYQLKKLIFANREGCEEFFNNDRDQDNYYNFRNLR